MMRNRFAGESLKYLDQLARGGARLNRQLVLCPGINDGAELERSMRDLEKLYPAVESVAAVPVGLTRFREGLPELQPFGKDTDVYKRQVRARGVFRCVGLVNGDV